MTKEERLRSGESLMSHAMVFTGYDKRDGEEDPNKWRVENRYMRRHACRLNLPHSIGMSMLTLGGDLFAGTTLRGFAVGNGSVAKSRY